MIAEVVGLLVLVVCCVGPAVKVLCDERRWDESAGRFRR